MIERSRMVAAAAEALDLAVERLVEREPRIALPALVGRVTAFCEDVLADYDEEVRREALYLYLALRLIRERPPAQPLRPVTA